MAAEHVGPKAAGVALIAADTGRVLMLQRAHDDPEDPAAGTWEFPGGHVESSDDSSLHGAIREWEEEVGRRMPKGATVAHAWRSPNGVYAGHVLVVPSEDQVNLSGRRVVTNPDDDSEQRAWWQVEHAKKNPALRAEARQTPWNHLSRIAREAQKRMNTKDVYASMAPATYTRGLGSGVGRSPMVIESHPKPPLAMAALRLRRRKVRDGAKALSSARARLETKLDPDVLEIYQGARRGAPAETKVRHVRTASGVRRYHAPVGTPIIGGRAVPSLPSAGGGRARAGRNAGRATTGLVGGNSRSGGSGNGKGGFTGRSRRGLGRRLGGRAARGGFNGGGGGGGLGGGALGGGLGQIFGGEGPGASAEPKKKKGKKPKQVKPPKAKKGSSTRGSGVKKGSTGKSSTSKKPTQAQVDDAAAQLVDVPPDRLTGILRTMPANVLPMLLSTIQDPEFAQRVAAARGGANAPAAGGAKSLSLGAALLEVKDAALGDERCMACGVDLDPGEDYATVATGKGYELVVCPPCGEETKAGDSGIPGHLPGQLRKYWTTGKGKARWAANPHPYTALVDGLRSEGVPGKVIHGLAANLFKDVFGIFPAQRPRALGGSTHGHGR